MAEPLDPQHAQPTLKREPVFFSRYRLMVELGRGGMGVVWQAEDTKLRRQVALKFLPDLVVRDREAMADLAVETRRCLELTHPHIVRVYDLVEDGTRAAISMELVDGGSLAERKLAQPDRCFSPDALSPWVAQSVGGGQAGAGYDGHNAGRPSGGETECPRLHFDAGDPDAGAGICRDDRSARHRGAPVAGAAVGRGGPGGWTGAAERSAGRGTGTDRAGIGVSDLHGAGRGEGASRERGREAGGRARCSAGGGTNASVTPAILTAQPSEKALNVEVFRRGYRRFRQNVTLKPGEMRTFNVGTLVAESGAIEFRRGNTEFSLPKAGVRIDGHAVTLVKGQVVGLEVGERAVLISHPDYEPWKQTVTVRDRQPMRVDVKLVPKPAVLTLAITGPTNYTLLAKGRPIAVKDGRATVPAEEPLALEIAANGFRTARLTRTLPAKGAETLALTLEKIAVAEPGKPWTIPEFGLTVMPVAAGTFAMGSENGDTNERPVTQVTITKPFWLGRTEVTQRQWTAIMGGNPSHFKGNLLPVESVSWTEAMEFCRKLTERERVADRLPAGYAYTLPTEAQWEYACRAGTTGDFAGEVAEMSWHAENSGGTTHAVGTKQANAWGLYDMHANVWEWCSDWYAAKLKGGSVNDPKGAASGTSRVRRGGSWVINARLCRSTLRGMGEPDYRTFNLGFRIALAPSP